jgi:large subunit ribosomal protein L11
MEFCKSFNARTQEQKGFIVPVVITVYGDRSFTFITKTPPASQLLMKALNKSKGSGEPNKKKIGTLTWDQIAEIAKVKLEDLNTTDLEAAKQIIAGTARSMGINVK